jgi:hypothetical protein
MNWGAIPPNLTPGKRLPDQRTPGGHTWEHGAHTTWAAARYDRCALTHGRGAHGQPPTSRFRHRGVVVTGDRALFNYRNRPYALDRRTGVPIPTFGDSGWVNLREGLGRPWTTPRPDAKLDRAQFLASRSRRLNSGR